MIVPTLLLLFLGWRVYLHAVSHGKNGMLWAIVTVSVAAGINFGVMAAFWAIGGMIDQKYGSKSVDEYSMFASVGALILSLIAVLLISNRIGYGLGDKADK
jgi:uncharacterized protein YqgC (DUF456 family)